MAYWIIKSEPGTYSFEDLERDKKTVWDGVRNYQARNNLKLMKIGDLAMVYHSVGPKELVGIVEVIKEAYRDPTANDDAWVAVDVQFKEWLKTPVTLAQIKENQGLKDIALVKQGRLSVCPVNGKEWQTLRKMGER